MFGDYCFYFWLGGFDLLYCVGLFCLIGIFEVIFGGVYFFDQVFVEQYLVFLDIGNYIVGSVFFIEKLDNCMQVFGGEL